MAIVVYLNGNPVNANRLSVSASQDNQDRLSAEIISKDGTLQPDIDDVIAVDQDSERFFAGSVKDPVLGGCGDAVLAITTRLSALDFNELATRFPITIQIPAGTLKAAATAVLVELNAGLTAGLQVTLGLVADGPALPELTYVDTYVNDILHDLSVRSTWLRNIDHNRALQFWQPGTLSAPWHVSDADKNAIGEMTVGKTRVNYANRVVVKYWNVGLRAWGFLRKTGTVSDGDQVHVGGRTYTFKTTLVDTAGFVLIGSDPIGNLNAAINHAGGGNYAPSTPVNSAVNSFMFLTDVIKVQALTIGAAGNTIDATTTGANLDWYWEGNQPIIALFGGHDPGIGEMAFLDDASEQTPFGRYTTIVEAPNVLTQADALSLAAAILATTTVVQRTVVYQTYRTGLYPGMTQTIQRANRYISASCLITNVEHVLQENRILRTVTAVAGAVFKGDRWRDQYKKWGGGTGRNAASTVLGGSGGSGGTTVLNARSVYFLGGNPETWVQSPTPTWVPASYGGGEGGISYVIDTAVRGTLLGTVTVMMRAQSGSVTARLWDIDNSVAVGTSTSVTSTTFQTRTFPVTLSSGAFRYRLELLPSVANVDVNGVGYLE